ncbi:MAG: hypothetical protein ACREE4_13935, partial [Stellaceae bacterium]
SGVISISSSLSRSQCESESTSSVMVRQPCNSPMFSWLAGHWFGLPETLEEGITVGLVAREPRPGWVPLRGLSVISDAFPPKAYADPDFAKVYNKEVRKFRRREALSALIARISKAELEERIEAIARVGKALRRYQSSNSSGEPTSSSPDSSN